MILVPFQQAKDHLRVDIDDGDADIYFKLEQASEIVVNYLKDPDNGWDEFTCPPLVQASILLVLGELYDGDRGTGDALSPAVKNILHRYRDPALA